MADDDKKSGNPMNELFLFLGFMAVLVALWYAAGGAGKADLKGLFLSPPAPLGTGEAYGPTFGNDASSTPKVEAPPTLDENNQY